MKRYFIASMIVFAAIFLASCQPGDSLDDPTVGSGEYRSEGLDALATEMAAWTPTPTSTPIVTPVATALPPDTNITFAVLGGDFEPTRPERNLYGIRTDVFVLINITMDYQKNVKHVDVFSLPRDLWVKVPCSPLDPAMEGYDRINAAWGYGRYECVRETVSLNFGLELKNVFYTDMDGFLALAKYFNGLDVSPSLTYTDWCGDYHGTDGWTGKWVTWREGVPTHMVPHELLCYIRARANAPTGDLDRNRRMIDVVLAAMDQYPQQVQDMAIWDFIDLWMDLAPYMQTDLGFNDLVVYGQLAISGSPFEDDVMWSFHRLTLDDVVFWRTPIYNASVLVPKYDLMMWMACTLDKPECRQTSTP